MTNSTKEANIIKELENFDTPTVTNAVATYPDAETCLKLYSQWEDNWYTDQNLRVMFPSLGRTCGYAVTCVYGLPEDRPGNAPSFGDLLHAIDDSPKPVIVIIKQNFPERLKAKVGLCGGNMTTAFKSMGCVGVISDGPSRDLDELSELGVQYMLTGTSAGHGPMVPHAINVPVNVSGMDVCTDEIVHMDINGAVKFPRKYLKEVLENCRLIAKNEEIKMKMMASSDDADLIAEYMKGNYK